MAFPFHFSADFSSVEYPAYRFRQTDFFHLRDHIKRKFSDAEADRKRISFTLPRIFGIMSFSVRVKLEDGKIRYTIDMMPVLLTVVLVLFVSLFLSMGSVMISLLVGGIALIFIYLFSLLIVNGMVRRVFEDFVTADMKKLEEKIRNPVCINCGEPMAPGQLICPHCEKAKSKEDDLTIKYTFTPDNKS